MQIALALYPKFTMLDIVGPFQVLVDVPGHDVAFVAAEKGLVPDHTGRSGLIATKAFNDMTAPDVIVIPGGMNDDMDGPVVDWIRHVHPITYTARSSHRRSNSPSNTIHSRPSMPVRRRRREPKWLSWFRHSSPCR